MSTLLGSLTLVEMTCCNCYTHFAMDRSIYDHHQKYGGSFYCPNGHGQIFTENKLEKLIKENKSLKDDLYWTEKSAETAREEARIAKQQKANIKRQLTNTRKRIVHGVCPCCHRTFKQLAAHIENKHPDFKAVAS